MPSLEFTQYAIPVLAMLGSGLFAGFMAGLFGIGGGVVVVPAISMVLSTFAQQGGNADHSMHVAIGTSLGTIVLTSLRSLRAHAQRGAVDFGILRAWSPWVVAGVGIGVLITGHLGGSALLRASLGALLGGLSALLGVGGGTQAVLIMTLSGVPMHRAVATAAGFGTVIAIPGVLGHMLIGWRAQGLPFGSLGFVNVAGMVAVTMASVITAPLGVAVAHSLTAPKLERAFGVYLLFTSGLMLHGYFTL
jgi:uncharacterized protein